jgi:hypothetical protein
MTNKIEYTGKVLSVCSYAAPTRNYRLGQNCDYPQYLNGDRFSLSKFLSKFEGKTVRLTLEVIK